jgi:predicted DNA binding CopG/RHH family protein
MKKDLFTKEEQEILRNFDAGKLKHVKNMDKEKKRYQGYAKYTLKKSRSINIRLPERDLQHLKAIAAEKGLPYQTLISSLLHQYATKETDRLV